MSTISNIPSITCKVECGTERGTAFFVDAHRLITAYHVVGAALNGNPIYVETEGLSYECELTIVKHGKDIAILKLKDEIVNHEYGSLLSMPIEAKTHFRFWGYPNTMIGEAVGQSVKIRIDETYVALKGDFDAYAVFEDEKHLTEYSGFSGSPVYADSDKIIGVVTNILDGHIGFISIKNVEDELMALGVFSESNYVEFQDVCYGRNDCAKKLHTHISLAGKRYKPELDVPNQTLAKKFDNLWDIRDLAKHEEVLRASKQLFISLQDSNPQLFTSPPDAKSNELDYNLGIQNAVEHLRHDTSKWKIINDALTNKGLSWKQIRESINYIIERREKVCCIYGPAGCGKTHNVCSIALKLIKETNIYLCFGIQFTKNKGGIIAEIRKIFNFENENYLEELQKKAIRDAESIGARRYIFIIDALNEGLDDSYWRNSLVVLKQEFDKYSNLGLVVTVRKPFQEKYELNKSGFIMQYLYGLENSEDVVSKYFDVYKINYNKKLSGFKNGLFLNIFCETYVSMPYYQRRWLRSLGVLYRQYINMRERDVAEVVDEDPEQNITWEYLCRLAHLSVFSYKFHPVTRKKARSVSNQLCKNRTWSKSLLYNLIAQGLLLADWNYQTNIFDEETVVKFEYEQMEDVIRAIAFLKTNSDEHTKIAMLKDWIGHYNREMLCQEGFFQFLTYVTILWPEKYNGREIIEEKTIRNNTLLQQCFIEGLEWHSQLVEQKLLDEFWEEAEKTLGYHFIFSVSLNSLNGFLKTLHRSLNTLDQAELDLKWTSVVNDHYEESVLYIEDINKVEYNTEAYLLVWCCASSHPVIRAHAKRKLCRILCNHRDLFEVLIRDFHSVKDTYVLEGLYNAIYGALLLLQEVEMSNTVSLLIYDYHFQDKQPTEDVRVREWLLKILLYTKIQKDGIDIFSKTFPPYTPQVEISYDTIRIDDNYFGDTEGSKKLMYSLCGFSDFHRYILGFNSNVESWIYTMMPHGQNKNPSMLPLVQLQSMVAQEIKTLGWNDKLGVLDNDVYSAGRYDNQRERIGKKYQWKALFAVEARLMDHFAVTDWWHFGAKGTKPILNPPYPWYSSTLNDFDVTLTTELIDDVEIDNVLDKQLPFVIDKTMSDHDWVKQPVTTDECQHFFVGEDNEWILLDKLFSESPTNGGHKDAYLSYDTFFVRNDDVLRFEEWITNQRIIGTEISPSGQCSDIRLLEYPWMLPYVNVSYENWNDVSTGDGKCPCQVMTTRFYQLQEDTMGLNDEYKESNKLPCPELMNTMGLHFKGHSCFTYGKDNKLASFYASTGNYRAGIPKGLHIRRAVLEEFLKAQGYTMYWIISAERQLIVGTTVVPNYKNYSFCAKYVEGGKLIWIKER
ncbi:MAG: trypsin-like peptidase domain-containing protein [Muribaculaceae bacterium]|nr:trypsin-like peptidase domain-containing protein [Muribaculaceae bacterium]